MKNLKLLAALLALAIGLAGCGNGSSTPQLQARKQAGRRQHDRLQHPKAGI